jgi:hypothetical protein
MYLMMVPQSLDLEDLELPPHPLEDLDPPHPLLPPPHPLDPLPNRRDCVCDVVKWNAIEEVRRYHDSTARSTNAQLNSPNQMFRTVESHIRSL